MTKLKIFKLKPANIMLICIIFFASACVSQRTYKKEIKALQESKQWEGVKVKK
jgi:hypothetical protein